MWHWKTLEELITDIRDFTTLCHKIFSRETSGYEKVQCDHHAIIVTTRHLQYSTRAFQIIESFHRWPLICSLSFAFLISFTLETLSLPLSFAQEQKKGTLIVYFCDSGASNFNIRDSWFVIFPSVNRARDSPRPLPLLHAKSCQLIKKLKLNILS